MDRWRLIFVLCFPLLTGMAQGAGATAVGQPAPALVAPDLSGATIDIARLRGKVVIVNFWATWCAPCRAEMPALDALYRAFRDRGLVLIGVSVDRPGDKAKVVATMNRFSYRAAMLDEARENGFPRPDAIPTTYIIDRRGVLRAVMRGATPRSLAETVLKLLRQRAPPAPSGLSASAR